MSHSRGFYSWWLIWLFPNPHFWMFELVVQVQSVEAQNIRVLSFNPTCFLFPQIVILSFYPQVSFLLFINRPPSVVLLQRICPSLHLKLFSISAVGNFIVRYFSCWLLFAGQHPHIVWITHSLKQAMLHHTAVLRVITFFNSFHMSLSLPVCLDFPISDSCYPQTCDCVGSFLFLRPIHW